MRKILLLFTAAFLIAGNALFAQGQNVNLLANVNDYPAIGYSDCWGYVAPDGREYALLGVNAGVSIVDVTDPANSHEVDFIPYVNDSWYDIKTYQHYMYVSSEGAPTLQIVDLSTLPDSASIVGQPTVFQTDPHNIYIDTEAGILYGLEDQASNIIRIFSLQDPETPNQIGLITAGGIGTDVHDVFAQDSVLYVAEGTNPTIGIFDVSDPANPVLISRVNVPVPGYVHNVWVSEDNKYMMTTEETAGKTVKMWDIQDLNNAILIDEYLGEAQLAHNVMIIGDYAYMSHYESGLKILDITNPASMVEVASYDTYLPGDNPSFNGAWGVYPFALNGKIFMGDGNTGLYVLEFDSVKAGHVEGTITEDPGGAPIEGVEVAVTSAGKTLYSDVNGFYALGLAAGFHSITFSKPGYFSKTTNVIVPEGVTVTWDITLEENRAVLGLSANQFEITLPPDTTGELTLIVRNDGPSGRLDYTLDDVNGPLSEQNVPGGNYPVNQGNFNFISDISATPRTIVSPSANLPEGSVAGDTVLVDPAGDLLLGSGGDIVGIYATTTDTDITLDFEFAAAADLDSTYILFSFDTDFDVNTGFFPGSFGQVPASSGVGAEYDIFVTLPAVTQIGAPPLNVSVWEATGGPPSSPPVFNGNVTVDSNMVSITIPLSVLGNDDGSMTMSGFGGHIDPANLQAVSLDLIPDLGSISIGDNPLGDLEWLDLSLESGSLMSAEEDTIILTFSSAGLVDGEQVDGVIAMESSDPNALFLGIPVTLHVLGNVDIEEPVTIVKQYKLDQNYPNPFNPKTQITFELPENAKVSLAVYNIIGQEVATLTKGLLNSGKHTVEWDGKNQFGNPVSSGVYFYKLTAGKFVQTRKMILLR